MLSKHYKEVVCPKPDESILNWIETEKIERRKAKIEKIKQKGSNQIRCKNPLLLYDKLENSLIMSCCVEENDGVVALWVSVWAERGEEVWLSEKNHRWLQLETVAVNCAQAVGPESWATIFGRTFLKKQKPGFIIPKIQRPTEDQRTCSWFWPDQ
jgi:hypothetical protein